MFLEADIAYEIVAALAFHSRESKDFPAFGIDFLQTRKNRNDWENERGRAENAHVPYSRRYVCEKKYQSSRAQYIDSTPPSRGERER